MSGLNKNRKRKQTVSFRVSEEEKRELEAKIIACGMPKAEFFLQSLLHQEIKSAVGKYQSDRLSLEVRRLQERLAQVNTDQEELLIVLEDRKALTKQLIQITEKSSSVSLAEELKMESQIEEKKAFKCRQTPKGRDLVENPNPITGYSTKVSFFFQ